MYVVIGAMAIFYLRMAQLRGRRKRLEREAIIKSTNKNRGKKSAVDIRQKNAPPYKITSWVIVVMAAVLMLVGVAAREWYVFPQLMRDYWWILTAGGVIMFMFGFEV